MPPLSGWDVGRLKPFSRSNASIAAPLGNFSIDAPRYS
jgi:hypothetical protein